MGGAYDSWDRGVVRVAEGLPRFLQACEHRVMRQLPQLRHFLWDSVNVDFEVCKMVDQRDGTSHFWDGELDHVAIEAFRSSCFVLHHFPGTRVSVFGGEEVGHSAAEHSHQRTTVGEVQSKSFVTTDSVLPPLMSPLAADTA